MGVLSFISNMFGWSGCEDMIIHLENNEEFWERCWMSTERGGHYVFRRL